MLRLFNQFRPSFLEGYFVLNEEISERAIKAFENGDYRTSLKIWHKYAPIGCPSSAIGLAMAYWKGKGVTQNLEKSFYWLIRGTMRKNDPQLWYNLAVCFETGIGTSPNNINSIFCAMCAVQLDRNQNSDVSMKAKELIDRLIQKLNTDDFKTYESLTKAIDIGMELTSSTFGIWRDLASRL